MHEHSRVPVALVTGCSSGIGRETAVLLAERDWHVFATVRRLETLSDLVSDRVTLLPLDVTDEPSTVAAVGLALAEAGRIDALVNCAGYGQGGPLEEATAAEVRDPFETNTFGPLLLAQLVLPTMRAHSGGRIVNVSTVGGRVAIPFIGLYSGSKFALEGMSEALWLETRPCGVRVIVIEPGGVRTNFNSMAAKRSIVSPRTRTPRITDTSSRSTALSSSRRRATRPRRRLRG